MSRVWVVIPAYNEAAWVADTLQSLAAQRNAQFSTLVVDNASTDETAEVVEKYIERNPDQQVALLREPRKGTGVACDAGFRHAIANGAELILRTDADCVADQDWVATMVQTLDNGLDLVAGNLRQRTDDGAGTRLGPVIVPLALALIRFIGRHRPNNNDNPEYLCKFVVVPGGNMGIRARTYEQAGGFPHTAIEEAHEDKEIVNRVRLVSPNVGFAKKAMVRFSNRRVARNGILRTLRWYFDHGGASAEVDIR